MPTIRGFGVSGGIALGQALVIGAREADVPRYRIPEGEERAELRRFLAARRRARAELAHVRDAARERVGEKYASIFDAHLLILDDRKLGQATFERIRERRMNAEWALAATVAALLRTFETMEDPFFRERGGDLQDVHQRMQRLLAGKSGGHERSLELREDTIVVAHELSPSDALWLHQPHIVGMVTEEGGRTSHTAILANALEIPAVVGARDVTWAVSEGDFVVVDGSRGRFVHHAEEALVETYRRDQKAQRRSEARLVAERGPVATRDGVSLRVSANIEFPEEMRTCERVGAQGVGLYRSEFLFLTTAPELPSVEDHRQAYLRIARAAAPESVVVRTLDLGGEKYFHDVLEGGEANPVLGLRAVRFCLRRPEIFATQLRGLYLAAAEAGNIHVLVPMITTLEEWRAVREHVERVKAELAREGVDVGDVPLGPMIEVPGAALVASALAREASFLAIGTNDLIQYTLAVDRSNASVAGLYDPFHPAVLSLIRMTLDAGRERGIPVSLCGEMASDALGALTLLGLGLERFSCNALVIPEIRSLLRHVSQADARDAVSRVLSEGGGASLRAPLEEAFGPLITEVLGRPSDADADEEERGADDPRGVGSPGLEEPAPEGEDAER